MPSKSQDFSTQHSRLLGRLWYGINIGILWHGQFSLISPLRYCGLLEASVAAYARAVALEPTIRTSIVHTWFLQLDNKRVASTKLEDNPYIVALSLAEVGRGNEAVATLRNLEAKIKTRMRDFMMAARTMIFA